MSLQFYTFSSENTLYFHVPGVQVYPRRVVQSIVTFGKKFNPPADSRYVPVIKPGLVRMKKEYGSLFNVHSKVCYEQGYVHFKGEHNIYIKKFYTYILDYSETELLYVDDKKIKTMDINGNVNIILPIEDGTTYTAVFARNEVIYLYITPGINGQLDTFSAKMPYGIQFTAEIPRYCTARLVSEYVVIDDVMGATVEIYDPTGKKITWPYPATTFYGEFIGTDTPYNEESQEVRIRADKITYITKINLLPRGSATKSAPKFCDDI